MTRTCGSCQLCCKLLPMRADSRPGGAIAAMIEKGVAKPEDFKSMIHEFTKPAGERCPKQKHGKGCAIYTKRPFCCRTWNCRWLVEDDVEGLPRPDHAHYVIDIVPDYVTAVDNQTGEKTQIPVVQIWVDPKYPDAHRDPALRAYLARRGEVDRMGAIIRFNSRDGLTVFPPAMMENREWAEFTGEFEADHKPMPMTAVFVED